MKQNKLNLIIILLMILILSFTCFYFLPFKVSDNVTVWFSNHRFRGHNGVADYPVFRVAEIGPGSSKGLNESVYIGNVSFLAIADNIAMWATDSRGLSSFPSIGQRDPFFEDEIYFRVSDVRVQGSKEGTNPILIPYFNPKADEDTYDNAYVDLDQVESLLAIEGSESYRLSISMVINYYLKAPELPFHSSNPTKIMDEKTVDFGNITISCNNGSHEYAHVDLPFQSFSYSVEVPFSSTLFGFF